MYFGSLHRPLAFCLARPASMAAWVSASGASFAQARRAASFASLRGYCCQKVSKPGASAFFALGLD